MDKPVKQVQEGQRRFGDNVKPAVIDDLVQVITHCLESIQFLGAKIDRVVVFFMSVWRDEFKIA